MEGVETRCAVSRGDFGGMSSFPFSSSASSTGRSGLGVASIDVMIIEPRGVEVAEDGSPSTREAGRSFEAFNSDGEVGRASAAVSTLTTS